MKITLYVRDVDTDIWEWAKSCAWRDRDSLSRVVVDALRTIREQEIRDQQRHPFHNGTTTTTR
jgi:hypothetical protein